MKNLFIQLTAICLIVVLTGCSSNNSNFTEQQIEREKQWRAFQQEKTALAQEDREKEIKALPAWVLNPPVDDVSGFHGVGIAESNDLSFSMKKARIQAEFELAKKYKQLLSGSERTYEVESAAGSISSKTEIIIDKIVEETSIVGYQVVEQVVRQQRGNHVTYTLLKLPYKKFNNVILERKNANINAEMVPAFQRLEQRLKQRQRLNMSTIKAQEPTGINDFSKVSTQVHSLSNIGAQ